MSGIGVIQTRAGVLAGVLLLAAGAVFAEEFVTGMAPVGQDVFEAMLAQDAAAHPESHRSVSLDSLPKRVDLSAHMPPVRSQGKQPSCVAWAAAYYLKSYQESVERRWSLEHPENIFSPAYVHNLIVASKGNVNAVTIPEALRLLHERGCVTWAAFPYDPEDHSRLPHGEVRPDPRDFRIHSWHPVDYRNLAMIKQWVYEGDPVIAGLQVDQQFYDFKGGSIITAHGPNPVFKYHAVCVVGYDDAMRAVRVINSWGTHWGDQGYAWIDYAFFQSMCQEAYRAKDWVAAQHTPAAVSALVTAFDLQTGVIEGNEEGIRVQVSVRTQDLKDQRLRLIVRFFDAQGTPLQDKDGRFATPEKHVGLAREFTPAGAGEAVESIDLFLPNAQLHLPTSERRELKALAEINRVAANALTPIHNTDFTAFTLDGPGLVNFERIWFTHKASEGGERGLRIHTAVEIHGLTGKDAELSVGLYDAGGNPVSGLTSEYTLPDGGVGTSMKARCVHPISFFKDFPLFIPFSQFNLGEEVKGKQALHVRVFVAGPSGPLAASGLIPFTYRPGRGSSD